MASSKLNKVLYTDITKLKLCCKPDAPVRFLLDRSPFDDEDEITGGAKSNEYLVIGRILPKSDIYKECAYKIEMKLTNTFPVDPPEVRFLTPIYHPNVDIDGNVKYYIFISKLKSVFSGKFCHDLLKKTAKWTMATSLVEVVKAVVDHIDSPNIDYSLSFG